jgi:influenza virus NS1A-binding protein
MGKKFTITISLILVMLLAIGSLSVISAQEAIRIGLEAEMTRYKLWCAVAEDKLFIFGGGDWEEPVPTEYYDFNTEVWGIYGVESYPPGGKNGVVVSVNNHLYGFAGENEAGTNKKCFIFDIEKGEWEELPGEATMGHYDGGAAVIGSKVYLIGGEDDRLSNEGFDYSKAVDIYDTETDSWELGPECPLPRQDTWAVALGTKVYLLGGQGGNETDASTDSVLILDTETNEWSEGPSLPYTWENPRAAVVNDKLYIMSGKGEGGYFTFELDSEVGEWKEMESYNVVTRYGCGITVYEDEIYLACGRDMNGEELNSIELYNPAADSYAE